MTTVTAPFEKHMFLDFKISSKNCSKVIFKIVIDRTELSISETRMPWLVQVGKGAMMSEWNYTQ